jgi:ribonuclease HI
MPRNPFFLNKIPPKREKKTCYAIYFKQNPESSTVVNDWGEAQLAMKGHKHVLHHGFMSKKEATAWIAQTHKIHAPSMAKSTSPKEAAVTGYPELVARMRNRHMQLYYTDCSFDPKTKVCTGGIWNPDLFFQKQMTFTGELDNHQRGEMTAAREAFQHYLIVLDDHPEETGICVLTDSHYVEQTLNKWVYDFQRNTDLLGRWLTARNTPVKHQDVIREILELKRQIIEKKKVPELFYIPRELNSFADAISRGRTIERDPEADGKFRIV